jgi:hypothetical protein
MAAHLSDLTITDVWQAMYIDYIFQK